MTEPIRLSAEIPAEAAGRRLDQVLAELFPEFSRSRLQRWVREGSVLLDGGLSSTRQRVAGGERVEISAEPGCEGQVTAQPIPLNILFEDDALLVIDKPAGMVVHPAAGNPDGTLQNALLHHDPKLAELPRAGIVHRLDKDTSGLLVVARSLPAHTSLVAQLQARTVHREYLALVNTRLTAGGCVNAPIGRHPRDRLRMAVVASGKPAVTHYRVSERFDAHTLLTVRLETGRTHQIRVHMAYIHAPLVGDPLYGGRNRLPRGADAAVRSAVADFSRQALHARRLKLLHPESATEVEWESGIPSDINHLLQVLRDSG